VDDTRIPHERSTPPDGDPFVATPALHGCVSGTVFLGILNEDEEEIVIKVPCRRCACSKAPASDSR
jgi:hypothetical protein